jgi:hypothetical protein
MLVVMVAPGATVPRFLEDWTVTSTTSASATRVSARANDVSSMDKITARESAIENLFFIFFSI